jgi:hypothetical protein
LRVRSWQTVTAAGVTLGFGLLVLVGAGLVVVAFGLPGRIRVRVPDARGPVTGEATG